MKKEIYIVTGAAGHLGSHVVHQLLKNENEVRALVLPNEECPEFINTNRHLLKQYIGNVCDEKSLETLFECDGSSDFIVIHCAGIVTISSKVNKHVFEVNVNGTANIIEACKRKHIKRLVYVSSVHAIPLLPKGQIMTEISQFDADSVTGYYAKTKAIATQKVLDAAKDGLDVVIVHPSGIIGPYGLSTGNMAQLSNIFLKGRLPFAVNGGFDFVDVRDVADGILKAADKGKNGQSYILSYRYVDIKEFFGTLSEVSCRKKIKIFLPLWVAKLFSPFAELYYRIAREVPLFTRYSLHTLSENGLYSHEKATRELGYTARPLKDTLADIVECKNNK